MADGTTQIDRPVDEVARIDLTTNAAKPTDGPAEAAGQTDQPATDKKGRPRTDRLTRAIAFLVVTVMALAGIVAVFVSSNTNGTAVLLALGALGIFCVVFQTQITRFKMGDIEIDLAKKVEDHLRSAFHKRLRGNYEGAELQIEQAFDRFSQALAGHEMTDFNNAKHYRHEVVEKLRRIAVSRFEGKLQTTSASNSLFPLVDVMLVTDGKRVKDALEADHRTICADLAEHLAQRELRVGVTIRPGPDLDVNLLVDRLYTNLQMGAMDATCFLLIQNCKDRRSGDEFARIAHQYGMHATNVRWASGGTGPELDRAIENAIMSICEGVPS